MSTRTLHPLHWFARSHDELPAFHAAYLALTFLAAALFNLGFFALLIIAHMALDVVKYREVHNKSWRNVAEGVVRESLLEFTVFAIALVFAVYLHHSLWLAGLTGVIRAQATLVRFLGTTLPKLTILAGFRNVITHLHTYLANTHSRLGLPWSGMERTFLFVLGFSVLALFAAVPITGADAAVWERIFVEELIPWNL